MEWDGFWRLLHLHGFHHNTPYTRGTKNHLHEMVTVLGQGLYIMLSGHCMNVVQHSSLYKLS